MSEQEAIETAYRMFAEAGLENGGLVAGADAGRAHAKIERFLDEHAPNRNARPCPACGRGSDLDCHEPYWTTGHGAGFRRRLIPHESRLALTTTAATSGKETR